MKKVVLILALMSINLLLQPLQSQADIVALDRVSDYTINSDASFAYRTDTIVKNTDPTNPAGLLASFDILASGATVSTEGWDSFLLASTVPLTTTYTFANHDPLGSASITRTYPSVDLYNARVILAPNEQRDLVFSYAGPAGIVVDKSSNAHFPWVDSHGYWEFLGNGTSPVPVSTFTVNITLPDTLDPTSLKLLGWDDTPTFPDLNKIQLSENNVTMVNENFVFKVANVPEPSAPLPLLGSALVGMGAFAWRRRPRGARG